MTLKERQEIYNIVDEINNILKVHNSERNQTIAKECLKVIDDLLNGKSTERHLLKISKHDGKMEGIRSLSTYKLVCDTCLKLKDNKATICNKCYVDNTFKRYPQMSLVMIYNTLILKYTDLKPRQIPIINDLYFRFESFSDLQNQRHLQNLYKIARKNPKTQFALWTKNYALLLKEKTPKNVNLILSSPILNERIPLAEKIINFIKDKTNAKHVKVFSVYDKNEIEKVGQNCMKKCQSCLKCYKAKDKAIFINELLK